VSEEDRTEAPPGAEILESFRGLEDWLRWRRAHPWCADPEHVAGIVERARHHGVTSPWLGRVAPAEVEVTDRNFRESFKARGLNARLRSVLDRLACMPEAGGRYTTRIYAPEALTPFALELRGRYARFLGSEYAPAPEARGALFPVPHEDLLALSFPDASFDVLLCNDVFEHVPDLPRALSELARVLRPGGTLLSTFPFAYNQQDTIVKAIREGSEVRILGEPEYHANPVDPRGSLVYQIPGWDVLERARGAGFARAELLFDSSRQRGICATELAGIFLLRAVR
jgi:SAM-dependent methyltransferase